MASPEIAQPIRSILRNRPDVSVMLRDVTEFDRIAIGVFGWASFCWLRP